MEKQDISRTNTTEIILNFSSSVLLPSFARQKSKNFKKIFLSEPYSIHILFFVKKTSFGTAHFFCIAIITNLKYRSIWENELASVVVFIAFSKKGTSEKIKHEKISLKGENSIQFPLIYMEDHIRRRGKLFYPQCAHIF